MAKKKHAPNLDHQGLTREHFPQEDPSENTEPSPKSRSQKKRDSLALQKEGERLASLSPAKRGELGLPPELEAAFGHYASMKTHEARRRQMQYIGRLMREWREEQADQE